MESLDVYQELGRVILSRYIEALVYEHAYRYNGGIMLAIIALQQRFPLSFLLKSIKSLATWGLFQLEKSLSPIKRKWLYVINLNFFVWRHECHNFLLNFWLKQIFSCLTPN